MEDNLNFKLDGRRSKFLAAIAALYVTMSVGHMVGWSVGWSVSTSFKVSSNALKSVGSTMNSE